MMFSEPKSYASIQDPERLVGAFIAEAVDARASDLFWIPASDRYDACYRSEGRLQTAVTTHGDWNYNPALRAALRQDVKTLVIGEMRDREIIETTLDAALSGHRVITTSHAGDIPGVYTRRLHQGMKPFLVASAITGVVSQRLLPLQDGSGLTPVAAVLEPDASWRSLVMEKPSLTRLRDEIRNYPIPDLVDSAKHLASEGLVSETEFESLRDSLC